jgi:hypothetical protein
MLQRIRKWIQLCPRRRDDDFIIILIAMAIATGMFDGGHKQNKPSPPQPPAVVR